MAEESANICLIGPSRAGKSALVASLVHAIQHRLHGFGPNISFAVAGWSDVQRKPTDRHAQFAAGLRPGEHKQLERSFLSQGEAESEFPSTSMETKLYKFRINSVPCTVVDTGGELLNMGNSKETYQELRELSERKKLTEEQTSYLKKLDDFVDKLSECNCLILTLPLVGFAQESWAPVLTMIWPAYLNARAPGKLQRIIVAWTHYDVLLAPFGPLAATLAFNPARGQQAVRMALQRHTLIRMLLNEMQQNLKPKDGTFPIHHVPVSSHGFISRNGSSFIHLKRGFEEYLGSPRKEEFETIREFWRPFLSADPVLAGAFGASGHKFMFPHEMFQSSETRKPQKGPENRPGIGLFAWLARLWRRIFGGKSVRSNDELPTQAWKRAS